MTQSNISKLRKSYELQTCKVYANMATGQVWIMGKTIEIESVEQLDELTDLLTQLRTDVYNKRMPLLTRIRLFIKHRLDGLL